MDNMLNEKELVDRAKNYDAEAFGQLYDLYFEKIYGYAYYKVGSRFDAEDIAEQVFLKALEKISGFEWRGVPFQAWLFRIAANLVNDYYRARKYKMVDIDDESELEVDGNQGPEESTIREIERKEVIEAIKTLTEEQQQVVTMRFIAGMSNEEVAKTINKSVGAVKALQHRAISALGRVLGEIYDEARY